MKKLTLFFTLGLATVITLAATGCSEKAGNTNDTINVSIPANSCVTTEDMEENSLCVTSLYDTGTASTTSLLTTSSSMINLFEAADTFTTEAPTANTFTTTSTFLNSIEGEDSSFLEQAGNIIAEKTVEQIVDEVLIGKWGNGDNRKSNLSIAGYDYDEIQRMVNEKLASQPIVTKDKSATQTSESTTIVEEERCTVTETELYNAESIDKTYVKHFSRGTYYSYGSPMYGGSGRSLIDCSYGDGTVKGSVASSYLYYNYGYNRGGRTMVYLEVNGYPSMNGYYYLDDCDAGNPEVIDFFYLCGGNCQFQTQGVVTVDCWLVS